MCESFSLLGPTKPVNPRSGKARIVWGYTRNSHGFYPRMVVMGHDVR